MQIYNLAVSFTVIVTASSTLRESKIYVGENLRELNSAGIKMCKNQNYVEVKTSL
jgi:hypothetical protein